MKYSDEILDNKTFNFFKQLMYNIALAICIMLVGVLVLVYVFKFNLYNVQSDSQAPLFTEGDMVVVKAQDEYKVGDIIKFDETDNNGWPTTHRLIAIMKDSNGVTRYICHGDNVQNLDGSASNQTSKDDQAIIDNLIEKGETFEEISAKYSIVIQAPTFEQIEGKIVTHLHNYGTYVKFIKAHYMLLIALVSGVWCISNVVQNEIDMKKSRRLF